MKPLQIKDDRYATLTRNTLNIFGEKGKKWLANLSTVVDVLTNHWQLSNLMPVDNMTFHFVAKASSNDKQPVILKIGCDEKTIQHEEQALRYFDGNGSIKLIDYHSQYHALLLEQAVPGISLKSIYPSQVELVMDYYVGTMQKLHSKPLLKKHGYIHISQWLEVIDNLKPGQLPDKLVKVAIQKKNHLLGTLGKEIFLHGDLHHDNILQDGNNWLAIDPKGIIGEAEFEIAAFDFMYVSELADAADVKSTFEKRVNLLAEKSNLDAQRVKDWVFVRLVLMAAWFIEDNGDPSWAIKLAEKIV